MTDPTADLDGFLASLKLEGEKTRQDLSDHISKYVEFQKQNADAHDVLTNRVEDVIKGLAKELAMINASLAQIATRITELEALLPADRENLVPRTYIPGETTTGAYGELKKQVGNLKTTHDGQIFEGLLLDACQITIEHSVIFKRCHIKGATPTAAGYAVVRCYKALAKPAQMIDCTIEAVPHKWSAACVQGRDIELVRCNIFGAVDGVMATNSNVKIISPWIHGLHWAADGHFNNTPTHNDLIQLEGGSGHEIVGGRLDVGSKNNAGIMITQNVAPIVGALIDSNWFFSEETVKDNQPPVAINMTSSGKGAMTGVEIINNRFSNQNMWRDNRAAWIDSATHASLVAANAMRNNEYLDGTPAKLSKG
jgi:hypothetical protein